ncbi:hypothetical protein JNUCC1_03083 [Lentibacillus sp. JNUCC-1]|nr:hypothetical protein [Lentibacillus sp. JNUCC-1]
MRDFLPVILTAMLVLPIGWLPAFMPQIMHKLAIKAQQPDIPEEQLEKDLDTYQSYLTRKYNMEATFDDEAFSEANGHYTVSAVPVNGENIPFTVSQDHNDNIRDTYIGSLWSKEIYDVFDPMVSQLYENVWIFETKVTTFREMDQYVLDNYEAIPDFFDVYSEFPNGYRFCITLYVFNDFSNEEEEQVKIYKLVEQLQESGITLTGFELKYYDQALYEQAGKDMKPTNEHRTYASHFLALNQQQLDSIQTLKTLENIWLNWKSSIKNRGGHMVSVEMGHEWEEEDNGTPAGFWMRLAAWGIDVLLVTFCLVFTKIAPHGSVALTGLLFGDRPADEYLMNYWVIQITMVLAVFWLYDAILESSPLQATVGKMLVKVKVSGEFNTKISFTKASGKFVLNVISLMLLGIGQFISLFTKDKQTIVDRVLNYGVYKA